MRTGVSRWSHGLLVTVAFAAACTPAGVGGLTHSALDELRRTGPALMDPDTLRDTSSALVSGVRISPELQADAVHLTDAVIVGAMGPVRAMVDGILGEVRRQLVEMVNQLDGPLARLTHAQLEAVRQEIRASIRDADVGLQLLIDHNTSRLAEQLRTTVGPALNEGVLSALEQGSDQIGSRMATGVGRGLRQQGQPAVQDVVGLNLLRSSPGQGGQTLLPAGMGYGVTLAAIGLIAYLIRDRMRLNELLARSFAQRSEPQHEKTPGAS